MSKIQHQIMTPRDSMLLNSIYVCKCYGYVCVFVCFACASYK